MVSLVVFALELFYVIYHIPVTRECDLIHFLEPAIILHGCAVMVAVIGHGVELASFGPAFVDFTYALLEKNTFTVQFAHPPQTLVIYNKIHVVIAHRSYLVNIFLYKRNVCFYATMCTLILYTKAHDYPIPILSNAFSTKVYRR